jgi:hypothetical protein
MNKKLLISLVPLLATAAFAVMPAAAQATTCKEAHDQSTPGSPVNATETCPHWFRNGQGPGTRIAAEEPVDVVLSGTLTLKTLTGGSGEVTCHNVVGATDENPGTGPKGPPGTDVTESFDPYNCTSTSCSASNPGGPRTYISVRAEPSSLGRAGNLGWPSHLVQEGFAGSPPDPLVRDESELVKVNVICHIDAVTHFTEHEEVSEGSNKPECSGPPPMRPSEHMNASLSPPELQFNAGSGTLHGPPGETGRTSKTENELKAIGSAGQEVINCAVG